MRPTADILAAASLVRKWRTACEEAGPAQDALEALTATSPPEDVRKWESIARKAAEDRRKNIPVMDTYDVARSSRTYLRHRHYSPFDMVTDSPLPNQDRTSPHAEGAGWKPTRRSCLDCIGRKNS